MRDSALAPKANVSRYSPDGFRLPVLANEHRRAITVLEVRLRRSWFGRSLLHQFCSTPGLHPCRPCCQQNKPISPTFLPGTVARSRQRCRNTGRPAMPCSSASKHAAQYLICCSLDTPVTPTFIPSAVTRQSGLLFLGHKQRFPDDKRQFLHAGRVRVINVSTVFPQDSLVPCSGCCCMPFCVASLC